VAKKGEKIAPVDDTTFSIQALVVNYHGASTGAPPREVQWIKPKPNTYKLNINAISCYSWVFNHILDASTAEALALQKVLQLIEDIRCSPTTIESDSLELVQAFNGVIESWSPYTAILADCFQKVRRIEHVQVQHCSREANGASHRLARISFEKNENFFWDGDPPSFLLDTLLNDVTIL
jgi:hypothetical protein